MEDAILNVPPMSLMPNQETKRKGVASTNVLHVEGWVVRVCKNIYLDTLNIGRKAAMGYILGQTSVDNMLQLTRQQIKQWILCRDPSTLSIDEVTLHKKNNQRKYLAPGVSIQKMFELYEEFRKKGMLPQ